MYELPRKAQIYVALTCLLALAFLLLGFAWGVDPRVALVLVGMTLIVERARTGTPLLSESTITLHMTLPLVIAAGIIGGPGCATLVGLASAFNRVHVPWVKRLFNGAQFAISAAVAGWVLEAFAMWRPGDGHFNAAYLLAVFLASICYCVANAALLSGILWFASGTSARQVIFGAVVQTAPSYIGYGVLGLMVAVLWTGVSPLAAVLVLLPLLAARWAWTQFALQQQAYESTIRTLVQAVETKDHYTRGHSERVAKASVMIARVLGIREDRVNALRYAGILHDVGKLGVPTKILQKSSGLSDDEFALIQTHPLRGTEMLQDIEFLDEAFKGILHHHERLDGLGYPAGLRGQEIPEFARVIAVADAFDSMTSTRSYRGARTPEDAMVEIERCRGTQFDPIMVDALTQALRREPWSPNRVAPPMDPTENVGLDHDDPTVDVVLGRESER